MYIAVTQKLQLTSLIFEHCKNSLSDAVTVSHVPFVDAAIEVKDSGLVQAIMR